MSTSGPPDPVAAANAYEEGLVPALMVEWPPRLIAAAAIRPGHRVLDVACGTGVLTRAVAAAVGPDGAAMGLDLDPGMLAVAERRRPDIRWHLGTADDLPFAATSFDAVVCQFGLMFFPNAPRALQEMWRVLKPGGRLAIAVWASLPATPAYDAETQLIERVAGAAAGAPLRLPFRLGNPAHLEALFGEAGLPLTSLTTIVGRGRFPSIRTMVEADLLGWLPVMGVNLAPSTIEAVLAQAEEVLAPYRQPDGTVAFDSPAHIAVAERAH